MDRRFDYTQKVLVAVEFADSPRQLANMPAGYAVFRRLTIPEVRQAFDETQGWVVQMLAGRQFQHVLDEHMGYWEKRVPAGRHCFVHHAIGPDSVIAAAYDRLKRDGGFVLLGIYHLEPQVSAYPASFPSGSMPNYWDLAETYAETPNSIFWFNFFPPAPFLFDKFFAIWATFHALRLKQRIECNHLVTREHNDPIVTDGVEPFAVINLNRYTDLAGYFRSAHDAGKNTFTVDRDYIWYGMLLRHV